MTAYEMAFALRKDKKLLFLFHNGLDERGSIKLDKNMSTLQAREDLNRYIALMTKNSITEHCCETTLLSTIDRRFHD